MKNKNDRYLQLGINGLLVVCGGIFFYYILFHSDKLSNLIYSFFAVLTPITAGIVFAYLLNPIVKFLETHAVNLLWNKIKNKSKVYKKERKVIRIICTFLALIIFLALIYSLVIMIVPQIIVNIQNIIDRIPSYFRNLNDYYNKTLDKYPGVDSLIKNYWSDITSWLYTTVIPNVEGIISKTSTSLFDIIVKTFKSVLNFIIGIIISIYLLIGKETFLAQAKKIIYALFKQESANNLINNLRYTNKIFGGFVIGKCIDSLIIGIICYIFMLIFKFPYPALISVIVGVTNVIPYFGPFIGAIPSAFIVLMVNPRQCIFFIIFILILQQIDGNILGPKILGDTTGLNSFWVIFAITVFSGIFGIVGMFIGVPVFAVIYAAIKTYIKQRLVKKNMPDDTKYYMDYDFHDDESVINDGKTFKFGAKAFEKVEPVISDEEKSRRAGIKSLKEKIIDSLDLEHDDTADENENNTETVNDEKTD